MSHSAKITTTRIWFRKIEQRLNTNATEQYKTKYKNQNTRKYVTWNITCYLILKPNFQRSGLVIKLQLKT